MIIIMAGQRLFTTIYKLRAAVFGGYDYEKLMADEKFSEEEYAVLVRLFGPNYNPEEPVIPMESSKEMQMLST